MQKTDLSKFSRVSVIFEKRSDGGLRAHSDDVPGFVLSSDDQEKVLADVAPALAVIISELVGRAVSVHLLEPWQKFQRGEEFVPFTGEGRETVEYLAAAA